MGCVRLVPKLSDTKLLGQSTIILYFAVPIKEQVTKVVKVGLRSGIRGRDSSEKPTAKGGF